MAGSLIAASGTNKIYDASKASANDEAGIYTTKIAAEGLFAEVPNTASAAVNVPVSIKAAQ